MRLLPVRPDHVRFCATGKQAKSQRRRHRLRHGSKRTLAMRAYMFVIFLGHFVGLLTPIQVFDARHGPLLRPCRKRPRHHSITSSASASSVGGISRSG